jgi:hypothetical protein
VANIKEVLTHALMADSRKDSIVHKLTRFVPDSLKFPSKGPQTA